MVDLAILIPVLPALGWLIISVFSKALGSKGSAWLATTLMALSAAIAIGLFIEINSAAPNWKAEPLEKLYDLEHHKTAGAESTTADHSAATKPTTTAEGETAVVEPITALTEEADKKAELLREALPSSNRALSGFPFVREWSWLSIKGEAGLPFGFYFDQTAGIVVLMVSVVAFLIHLFSVGYMAGEERYPTFFAYINLFAAAMLAMVMAKNLFHVLLFWEIMGVMSYLLIGFFYKKKTAQQAMKKAFMTVRVGDLAFMAGLFWLYSSFKTLDIPTILEAGASGELLRVLGVTAAGGIGLLLFIAAMGKSAQFPLHVWLADAMEGPTPVSAMIHAATMVAAGVYLVARAYPILEVGHVLPFVALIGGFTAIFAASMAPAQADAKKIMAFSTLSQLGYMFLSLGAFGYTAALFHLLTHAFFKALLFLGSGSMIHGSGTQDIFEMDRLAKYQKWTLGTVWVGALSLMGAPLFAGFWSKDEILHAVQSAGGLYWILWLMAVITAILTAFYTTRMMIIAFYKPKTASPWAAAPWNNEGEPTLNISKTELELQKAHEHGHHVSDHPHESGPEMIIPLVLLATMAMVMGFVGSPFANGWFQRFVYFGEAPELVPLGAAVPGFIVSILLVAAGAGASYMLYGGARDHTKQIAPIWLTRLLQRRYFIDDFYYHGFVRLAEDIQYPLAWFDKNVVDRIVDGFGIVTGAVGDTLRRAQSGAVGLYAWLMVVGGAVIALAFAFAQGGNK